MTTPAATPRLRDYQRHYRADADFIEDPTALSSLRSASERRRLQVIVDHLHLRPGQRLADLGCGSGWMAQLCGGKGAHVIACDIAPAGVAAARRRFPQAADFVACDVYAIGLRTASCDVVVLSEVVEHLHDVDAGLREAARLLCPGGRLIVTVPYRESILQHLCIHCNQLTPANAHLHSFDIDRLVGVVSQAGLKPLRTMRMGNKVLELLRFSQWSRWLPQWAWRGIDALCNRVTGKAAFLLIEAESI